MTRDEAEKIARPFWGGCADNGIKMLVELGMLKLDEPKSAQQKFYDVIATELAVDSPAMRNVMDNKHVAAMIFYDALKEAGLRIVEK